MINTQSALLWTYEMEQMNFAAQKVRIGEMLSHCVKDLLVISAYFIAAYSVYSQSWPDFIFKLNINNYLLTVIVHSSNVTRNRLHENLEQYMSVMEPVKYFSVWPEKVIPEKVGDPIQTRCADVRDGEIGLACKNGAAYEHFIKRPHLGNWLFRAMDDTVVNIPNLVKLVKQLEQVYDPKKHVVFRAYVTDGHNLIGGGSGWLISRALAEVNAIEKYTFGIIVQKSMRHQDDTAMTIIARMIFKHIETWKESRMIEDCVNCDGERWARGDFERIERCPSDKILIKMNDVVSFHPRKNINNRNRPAAQIIGKYPDDVYFYQTPYTQSVTVCRDRPGIIDNRTTTPYIRDWAQYTTVDDLRQ